MIHDKLENLRHYLPERCREAVLAYMRRLGPKSPEERAPICGEDAFGRVMSYPTRMPQEATVEAHDRYVDVQFTLAGAEGISVFPRDGLEETGWRPEDDFRSYAPAPEPGARAINLPGYFTMLFPHEAHRPQESVDGACAVVKKGVVKIRADLFARCEEGER